MVYPQTNDQPWLGWIQGTEFLVFWNVYALLCYIFGIFKPLDMLLIPEKKKLEMLVVNRWLNRLLWYNRKRGTDR